MAVTAQTPLISYTASGAASFTYPFRILEAADLKVFLNGVQTVVGFTVSGVGSNTGGTVLFSTAPSAGTVVKLQRSIARTRTTDYVEGGALRADVLDADIDRAVMMLQDVEAAQNEVSPSYAATFKTQVFSATAAQTAFTVTVASFSPGSGNLEVFVNGAKQILGVDYLETSSNIFTMTAGLNLGDDVQARITDLRAVNSSNTVLQTLLVDTTGYAPKPLDPFGFVVRNDNVYVNIDQYGSGSFAFDHSRAINNNQPNTFFINNNAVSGFGNSAALELCNVAGGYNAGYGDGVNATFNSANHIEIGIEFVAPNRVLNDYNGKFKISSVSGRTGSSAQDTDGYTYFGTRRSALHPSGANTGFESQMEIYSMSAVGLGEMLYRGNGIRVVPRYDFGVDALLQLQAGYQNAVMDVKSSFNNSFINNSSTGASGKSQIVNDSANGAAEIFTTANSGNAGANLNVRTNWTTPGSGAADLNLWVDNTGGNKSGWNFNVIGQTGPTTSNLFLNKVQAGVSSTLFQFNTNSSLVIYNAPDPYLQMNSNTASTGRQFRIQCTGTTSQLQLRDQTNNVPLVSLNSLTASTGKGKALMHYGIQVGSSASATYKTAGFATLVSGTVTITTAAIASTSLVMVWLKSPAGTLGAHYCSPTRTAGTSFVINSVSTAGTVVSTDTSVVEWLIIDSVT